MDAGLLHRIYETIMDLAEFDEEDYQKIKSDTLKQLADKSEGLKLFFDKVFELAEEKRMEKIAS